MSAQPDDGGPPTSRSRVLTDLSKLSPVEREAVAVRYHPGVFAERRLGYVNAPFHWEWYDEMMRWERLCCVAPRDDAKTEAFTVVQSAWRAIMQPGIWTYVFAATGDQAEDLKTRIDEAVLHVSPELVEGARISTTKQSVYANRSRVSVAGAGKAVRGGHPDIIIGDDVLEEARTLTAYQRKKTERWWLGTIGGMGHSGVRRRLGGGRYAALPPTRIYLVGTPFHASDLVMQMKTNALYRYIRYAAEFDPERCVDGSYAVEAA